MLRETCYNCGYHPLYYKNKHLICENCGPINHVKSIATVYHQPLLVDNFYCWQSSFTDAFAYDYVIPYDKFKKLGGYVEYCGSSLYKKYYTYKDAINSLNKL